MDERLQKAIESVLYRKGSAKKSTVQIEVTRMSELRKAFEALQPEKTLEVHQRWQPELGNAPTRTIEELSEHRVGYSYVGDTGQQQLTSCSREQWATWAKNTRARCLEVADYAR